MHHDDIIRRAAEVLKTEAPALDKNSLREYVRPFLNARERYLAAAEEAGAPLYLFDEAALVKRAEEFRGTFQAVIPDVHCYYAIKSNYHSFFLQTLSRIGYGFDVSSGEELRRAIEHGPGGLLFSGPGKTREELRLACTVAKRVTILIDSFGELDRLEAVAGQAGVTMTAGVRVTVEDRGLWRKFGIPLDRLAEFLTKAHACSHVRVEGLHYHTSWNMDTTQHETFLGRLGRQVQSLPAEYINELSFLDMGGGFWPYEGEWLHASVTPAGRLRQCVTPDELPGM
ncbi:MAG: alanine racemase, partial [Candidatus Omnitrophica bacterium]|nr:alanine racemase [Candidatus Omnitrophota bacterium]